MVNALDLGVMDSVFYAFIQSNQFQGDHYTLEQLIQMARSSQKFYPLFSHAGSPWLATVQLRREPDGDVVCIRLPNNGYDAYNVPPRTARTQQFPHFYHGQREGWYQLTTPYMQRFTHMTAVFSARYETAWVVYHPDQKRADFQFIPKDGHALAVRICFEQGHPYFNPNDRHLINLA